MLGYNTVSIEIKKGYGKDMFREDIKEYMK